MSELASQIVTLTDTIKNFRDDHAGRLNDIEKHLSRMPSDYFEAANDNDARSIGLRLVSSNNFRDLNGGRNRARAFVELGAITSGNTTVGAGRSQSTSLVQADRVPGIIAPPERKLTVRDLIAVGKTSSNSIEFVKETSFTNAAAPVAETTSKPYSDLTFDMTSAPVRTLAHLFKISKQMLDDVDGLVSYIDVRGTYGLKEKEDQQLLFGSGTAQNLLGLIPQATAFDNTLRKSGDQMVDTIRRSILQVRKAQYRASGVVMSPTDWANIELLKDAGANYLWSNPIINNGQNLWGIPVIDCDVMPEGQFLTGAFNVAAQVFDRQQATLEVSTENEDDFSKNMATVRIEERLALATYRPASFVYGAFAA